MFKRLNQASTALMVAGWLMLPILVASLLGLVLDPRVVTGAPVWLKPAKFAASIALYSFTMAWIFTRLQDWVRTRRIVGWTTAIALVVEMAIVGLQAARGTTSHFNVSTPLDTALWSVMGVVIIVQTFSSVAVAVALWRQPFTDRALGWALRLGMAVTIAGALSGGVMAQPTSGQLASARGGQRLTTAGSHTIGGDDGGAGLPGTGWSLEHGDVRVAHFVGLHALQILPFMALFMGRLHWSEAARVRLTLTAGGSYFALFGLLFWQALRGQSVFAPDALISAVFAGWMAITIGAAAVSCVERSPVQKPAVI